MDIHTARNPAVVENKSCALLVIDTGSTKM